MASSEFVHELAHQKRPEWTKTLFHEGISPILWFVILGGLILGIMATVWAKVLRGNQDYEKTKGYVEVLDVDGEGTSDSATNNDEKKKPVYQLGYSKHIYSTFMFYYFAVYASIIHILAWLIVLAFYKPTIKFLRRAMLNFGFGLNVCVVPALDDPTDTNTEIDTIPWCSSTLRAPTTTSQLFDLLAFNLFFLWLPSLLLAYGYFLNRMKVEKFLLKPTMLKDCTKVMVGKEKKVKSKTNLTKSIDNKATMFHLEMVPLALLDVESSNKLKELIIQNGYDDRYLRYSCKRFWYNIKTYNFVSIENQIGSGNKISSNDMHKLMNQDELPSESNTKSNSSIQQFQGGNRSLSLILNGINSPFGDYKVPSLLHFSSKEFLNAVFIWQVHNQIWLCYYYYWYVSILNLILSFCTGLASAASNRRQQLDIREMAGGNSATNSNSNKDIEESNSNSDDSNDSNSNSVSRLIGWKSNGPLVRSALTKSTLISDLVPGDVYIVPTGTSVPADSVVLSGSVVTQESDLTGEPLPIQKFAIEITDDNDSSALFYPNRSKHGKKHFLFSGTEIMQSVGSQLADGTGGRAIALVTHTGADTKRGEILKDIMCGGENNKVEDEEEEDDEIDDIESDDVEKDSSKKKNLNKKHSTSSKSRISKTAQALSAPLSFTSNINETYPYLCALSFTFALLCILLQKDLWTDPKGTLIRAAPLNLVETFSTMTGIINPLTLVGLAQSQLWGAKRLRNEREESMLVKMWKWIMGLIGCGSVAASKKDKKSESDSSTESANSDNSEHSFGQQIQINPSTYKPNIPGGSPYHVRCLDLDKLLVAGRIQVQCWDKTGTLTTGVLEMVGARSVVQVNIPSSNLDTVVTQNQNHNTKGKKSDTLDFSNRDMDVKRVVAGTKTVPNQIVTKSANGNNLNHNGNTNSPIDLLKLAISSCHTVSKLTVKGQLQLVGNAVEVEMVRASQRAGIDFIYKESGYSFFHINDPQKQPLFRTLRQFEFCQHAQLQSCIIDVMSKEVRQNLNLNLGTAVTNNTQNKFDSPILLTKGAFEKVALKCKSESLPASYRAYTKQLASEGVYVLAVAYKVLNNTTSDSNSKTKSNNNSKNYKSSPRDQLEQDLNLLGLLLFKSELKPDSASAIEILKNGGIRSVMITGDNIYTGLKVAAECGILAETANGKSIKSSNANGGLIFTGDVNPKTGKLGWEASKVVWQGASGLGLEGVCNEENDSSSSSSSSSSGSVSSKSSETSSNRGSDTESDGGSDHIYDHQHGLLSRSISDLSVSKTSISDVHDLSGIVTTKTVIKSKSETKTKTTKSTRTQSQSSINISGTVGTLGFSKSSLKGRVDRSMSLPRTISGDDLFTQALRQISNGEDNANLNDQESRDSINANGNGQSLRYFNKISENKEDLDPFDLTAANNLDTIEESMAQTERQPLLLSNPTSSITERFTSSISNNKLNNIKSESRLDHQYQSNLKRNIAEATFDNGLNENINQLSLLSAPGDLLMLANSGRHRDYNDRHHHRNMSNQINCSNTINNETMHSLRDFVKNQAQFSHNTFGGFGRSNSKRTVMDIFGGTSEDDEDDEENNENDEFNLSNTRNLVAKSNNINIKSDTSRRPSLQKTKSAAASPSNKSLNKNNFSKSEDSDDATLHDLHHLLSRSNFALTQTAYDYLKKNDPIILQKIFSRVLVWARMTPVGKIEVVERWRQGKTNGTFENKIVGMCGDGGNDSGALVAAHVGLALSESDASVVASFSSNRHSIHAVVDIIREGRCTLENCKSVFGYMAMSSMMVSFGKIIANVFVVYMAEWPYAVRDVLALPGFGCWAIPSMHASERGIRNGSLDTKNVLQSTITPPRLMHWKNWLRLITFSLCFYISICIAMGWVLVSEDSSDVEWYRGHLFSQDVPIPFNDIYARATHAGSNILAVWYHMALATSGMLFTFGGTQIGRQMWYTNWRLILCLITLSFPIILIFSGPQFGSNITSSSDSSIGTTWAHCMCRTNCDDYHSWRKTPAIAALMSHSGSGVAGNGIWFRAISSRDMPRIIEEGKNQMTEHDMSDVNANGGENSSESMTFNNSEYEKHIRRIVEYRVNKKTSNSGTGDSESETDVSNKIQKFREAFRQLSIPNDTDDNNSKNTTDKTLYDLEIETNTKSNNSESSTVTFKDYISTDLTTIKETDARKVLLLKMTQLVVGETGDSYPQAKNEDDADDSTANKLPDTFKQRVQKHISNMSNSISTELTMSESKSSFTIPQVRFSLHTATNNAVRDQKSAGAVVFGIQFGGIKKRNHNDSTTQIIRNRPLTETELKDDVEFLKKYDNNLTNIENPFSDDDLLNTCFDMCELSKRQTKVVLAEFLKNNNSIGSTAASGNTNGVVQNQSKIPDLPTDPKLLPEFDDSINRRFVCHYVAYSWRERQCWLLPREDGDRSFAVGPEAYNYRTQLKDGGKSSSGSTSDAKDNSTRFNMEWNSAFFKETKPKESTKNTTSSSTSSLRVFAVNRTNIIGLKPTSASLNPGFYSASNVAMLNKNVAPLGHYTPASSVNYGFRFGFMLLFIVILLVNGGLGWWIISNTVGGKSKSIKSSKSSKGNLGKGD